MSDEKTKQILRALVNELRQMVAEFESVARRAGWSDADIEHKTKSARACLRARLSEEETRNG